MQNAREMPQNDVEVAVLGDAPAVSSRLTQSAPPVVTAAVSAASSTSRSGWGGNDGL